MNEEYLWDKSGEPDPEIQKLEQVLGTLRYQPRPFDLGNEVPGRHRNRYLPLLAIAATLLVALLAAGLWLRARRTISPSIHEVLNESPAPSPQKVLPEQDQKPVNQVVQQDQKPERRLVAKGFRHLRVLPASDMTALERERAIEAKEQLMTALRLASEKLNFAQRKAQGASPNQIRNQHKIG